MSVRRLLASLAAAAVTVCGFAGGVQAACDPGIDLVISEFMAANEHSLADEDDAASASAASREELEAARLDTALATQRAGHVRLRPARPAGSGPATLALASSSGRLARGERRKILVRLNHADGIEALDLRLSYPARQLGVVAIEPAGIGASLSLASRDEDGMLQVGLYGLDPLAGSGTLIAITVEARQPLRGLPRLRLEGSANEGAISVSSASPAAEGSPRQKRKP